MSNVNFVILSKVSLLQNKYYFLSMTSSRCLQFRFIRSCGEWFPQDLMKLTCRQRKRVIERKYLFCNRETLDSIISNRIRTIIQIKFCYTENLYEVETSMLVVNLVNTEMVDLVHFVNERDTVLPK